MSTTTSETGRSGSRRSGRRPRSGGRREGRREEGIRHEGTNSVARYQPKAEPGLLQKIISFFKGEKEAPKERPESRESRSGGSRPRGGSGSGGERPSSRPRRESSENSGAGLPPRERRSTLRKPDPVEVTSPRLYIGNLSFDATESDLFELFNGVGNVENVEVVSNKHTLRSKGFAFVQMHSVDEAKRAVEELHDKEYMGRKLVVNGAKALEERRSDRERPEQQPEQ